MGNTIKTAGVVLGVAGILAAGLILLIREIGRYVDEMHPDGGKEDTDERE